MQRNGIRARKADGMQSCPASVSAALRGFLCISHVLLSFALAFTGCSLINSSNESIIRLQTKQNTPRANRLTHAGIRALNRGQITLASAKFREAIRADMSYGPAHNNLGLMHYEQGNLYQAVLAFEEARQFLPNDPAVIYNLGMALESAGQIDEARDLYYTAVEMDKANPNFLGNLCRLRVRMGERDEHLKQQLRDLILIETRPDWRRWADMQLGLAMNDALDRGPETPDFENDDESDRANATPLKDKIIDLSPTSSLTYSDGPIESSIDDPTDQILDPIRENDLHNSDALQFQPPRDQAPMPEPELMLKNVAPPQSITDEDYYRM